MRSRLIALAGVAVLLGLPLAASAGAPPVQPVVGTLAGAGRLLIPGAQDVGPAPVNARQHVVLVLGLRNHAGLDRLLRDQQIPGSSDYQRWLTPAQFAARFSPTPAAVATAREWARQNALTISQVSSNRTLISLEASVGQLNRAFQVQLRTIRTPSTTYVTPDRTAALPSSLGAAASAVLGLTSYQPAKTLHTLSPAPTTQAPRYTFYGPQDFYRIYHAPARTPGAGAVAVITNGNLDTVPEDLKAFRRAYNLPPVKLEIVNVTPPGNKTMNAIEYALDTQYSAGLAPGVRTVIAYNGTVLGAPEQLNKFVTERRARTASASYGLCEYYATVLGQMRTDDAIFQQAVAQGQTVFASSGDDGSNCKEQITKTDVRYVLYPASSPYVVAVGGTTLTAATRQPKREITWTGGGGGQSAVELAPSWQKASGAFSPLLGRGLPDVSLDADPKSGYVIMFRGRFMPIGGTSASAPAWNGIWNRVLQRHPKLGFAAPSIYRSPANVLTDITEGDNGDYFATRGYDLATGLGSVDISRLVDTAH